VDGYFLVGARADRVSIQVFLIALPRCGEVVGFLYMMALMLVLCIGHQQAQDGLAPERANDRNPQLGNDVSGA
jgi:hypothetical protein